MNCVLRNAAINSVVQDQLYQDKFSVCKTCHSHLYTYINHHAFTGGCACETYCTFGHPVPVGTCMHSCVILLACSVYITLQVYHLFLLPFLLLLLCPLRIKAISKMVGISVAILQYKLHSETNIILKNGSYCAETQQSLY